MVYKSLHGFTPTYMKEMFVYTFALHMQRGKTEIHKKRFLYIGAKQWNELVLPSSLSEKLTL